MKIKHTYFVYSLLCCVIFSNFGMQLTKRPFDFKKKFIRTAINKSPELDVIRQTWNINNSPQEVVDISQGKVVIKEEISVGKRYGTSHNYAFTKLMGIVGKASTVLNIPGQRDYYVHAQITDDGKQELFGLSMLDFFDSVDGKCIQPGDIAIYVSDEDKKYLVNRIQHTGIVVGNDCIESKWGPIHAIFEHPIWYVPAEFGNHIVYCRLKIEKARLLEEIQKKLQNESIKKKYEEIAYKNQQELFDNLKQYEQDKDITYLSKIYRTLEYDMNVHLDVPDENGVNALMHAKRIGCEDLQEMFETYQAYRE